MNKKISSINKKGDLPVTLLVIGIFAVCAFALLTFFISDFKISNSFAGPNKMMNINAYADEYMFYKNAGMSDDKLKSLFNITTEYGRDYFEDNVTDIKGGIWIFGGKKVLEFSVKSQVPSYSFVPSGS